MDINDKKKILSDLAYAINRIPLSLYHGNTNQIGRDAWNGLVEYIVNAVCRYVNMLNSDFTGSGTKINPLDHPRFLHPDLPPFVNTRVYNNNFHISIGLVSSSLDTHDVTNVHMTALGNAALDDEGGCRADSYVHGQDLGAGSGAAFEASVVNIGLEQVQASLGLPQGPAKPPPPPATQPVVSRTVSQEEMKGLQAKELLRTLSSAMEKPYWDTCQRTLTDPCIMLNFGRTPDITVTIVPDNYTENLTYPIFIGEVLGKKAKGPHLSQRYAGYNATMQSLVFSPRAYYWEIGTTAPSLHILNKQPSHGRINVNKKTYKLAERAQFMEMINDFVDVFLDELINLRPVTYLSSQCLRKKQYKDFLSKPSGLEQNIEDQCWHLFVPKYNCQGINAVPEKYIEAVDHEDPGKEFSARYPVNDWPLFKTVINKNKVLQVDQWNITEGAFGDLTFCHAFRDNAGNARDMKEKDLMTEIQKNAKNLAKQTAFSDITDILSMVSTANFLTRGIKSRLTAANTEIDPPPALDANDWELKYYNKEIMLSCVKDVTMNLSLVYESDDDYVDPENILAEPPPQMDLDVDDEDEDVEMQPLAGPSGIGTAGPTTMGTTGATPQMGPGGDVITDEKPLKSTRVRFDSLTDFVVRQYICSIPEPVEQRGVWTPTRTPRTRAQHRATIARLTSQQASTASPVSMQTQQPVRRTLYPQTIITTGETPPTSPPGGITTAVESLTITAEPLVLGTSTGGPEGAVGGVTPTVSPTKGVIGSAFDRLKKKMSKKR